MKWTIVIVLQRNSLDFFCCFLICLVIWYVCCRHKKTHWHSLKQLIALSRSTIMSYDSWVQNITKTAKPKYVIIINEFTTEQNSGHMIEYHNEWLMLFRISYSISSYCIISQRRWMLNGNINVNTVNSTQKFIKTPCIPNSKK